MNVIDLIKLDKYRYTGNTCSFLRTYYAYEGFRFSVWLRVCNALYKKKITKYTLLVLAKIVFKHYKYKYGYMVVDITTIVLFAYAVIDMLTTNFNPFIYFRV